MRLTPNSIVTFFTLAISIALFPMFMLPWFIKSGIQPTFTLASFSLFSIMTVTGYKAMSNLYKLTFLKLNASINPQVLIDPDSYKKRISILYYTSLFLILIGTTTSLLLEKSMRVPFLSTIFPAAMIVFSLFIVRFKSSKHIIGLLLPFSFLIAAFFLFYVEKTSINAGLESYPVLFSKAIIFWLYLVLSLIIVINLNLDYIEKASQFSNEIDTINAPKIDYPTDLKPFFLLLILLSWSYRHFIIFSPWNMLLTLAPLSVFIFLLNWYSTKFDFRKSALLAKLIAALFLLHFVYFMYDLNIFKAF